MSEDLLPYFLAEGRELSERAGRALYDIERGVGRAEALEQAFRAIHTLKGSTALFEMAELTALLHAAESELEGARRRGGALAPDGLSALDACLGEFELWLEALEAGGEASPERRRAAAALAAGFAEAATAAPAPVAAVSADWTLDLARQAGIDGARVAVRYTPDTQAYFRGEDPLALMQRVPELQWLGLETRGAASQTPFDCDLVLHALSAASREAVAAALRLAGDQAEIVALQVAPPPREAAPAASRTVRVEAAQLEAAADLLDQLILAKNTLAHETALATHAPGVVRAQLQMERAAAALHESLGRLRLAPLRRLFAPLPRQVREMAADLGKQAQLTISGEDVAVDKAILDGLYEPLIHVLRNAVDHGLESTQARRAAGKPERGEVRLSANPRGDAVEIEVADDGAGLDLARIRATAVARGLLSPEAAQALSDRQAADLIFAPGFSTARAVTEMSGRGVGLDAVRAALARIGGRVEVESRPGFGAVVRMIAPLRTVLTRVAVVCVGAERFGAPLRSLREIVRISRADIAPARTGEAVVVRDEVIPLLHLADLIGATRVDVDPLTVAIVESGEGLVGVGFDRLAEMLETPVQAASPLLAAVKGVAGCIVQGDGRVLLLLDLAEMIA